MKPRNRGIRISTRSHSQVMDYHTLSGRLKKTLYFGPMSEMLDGTTSSLPLTNVLVEKFGQNDTLFLEKLCFDYAADLTRKACPSPCSLVLAVIYLERLSEKNPNFISSIPSSKLFLISVMMASKFLNDDGEEDEVINAEWANSANIDLTELNQLERQFLQAIDWALYVDEEDFATALDRLEFRVAQRETLKRGWLTYTDLDVLARTQLLFDTWQLVHRLVINVSITCMAAYVASVVTLVGSALVVSSMPWNNSPSCLTTSLSASPGSNATNLLSPNPEAEENQLANISDPNSLDIHLPESFSDLPGSVLSSNRGLTFGTFPHLSNPPYFFRVPAAEENSTLALFPSPPLNDITLLPRCTLTDSVSLLAGNPHVSTFPLCMAA